MKKFNPVLKVKNIATEQSIRLVEKTIAKTAEANNFLTNIADVFLFLIRIIKETFSRTFELKEFLRQCFQIGNKTLPLISVTGIIIGLVLTIQIAAIPSEFRGSQPASGIGGYISHQGNGAGNNSLDMCRENRIGHGCGARLNESIGAD